MAPFEPCLATGRSWSNDARRPAPRASPVGAGRVAARCRLRTACLRARRQLGEVSRDEGHDPPVKRDLWQGRVSPVLVEGGLREGSGARGDRGAGRGGHPCARPESSNCRRRRSSRARRARTCSAGPRPPGLLRVLGLRWASASSAWPRPQSRRRPEAGTRQRRRSAPPPRSPCEHTGAGPNQPRAQLVRGARSRPGRRRSRVAARAGARPGAVQPGLPTKIGGHGRKRPATRGRRGTCLRSPRPRPMCLAPLASPQRRPPPRAVSVMTTSAVRAKDSEFHQPCADGCHAGAPPGFRQHASARRCHVLRQVGADEQAAGAADVGQAMPQVDWPFGPRPAGVRARRVSTASVLMSQTDVLSSVNGQRTYGVALGVETEGRADEGLSAAGVCRARRNVAGARRQTTPPGGDTSGKQAVPVLERTGSGPNQTTAPRPPQDA